MPGLSSEKQAFWNCILQQPRCHRVSMAHVWRKNRGVQGGAERQSQEDDKAGVPYSLPVSSVKGHPPGCPHIRRAGPQPCISEHYPQMHLFVQFISIL